MSQRKNLLTHVLKKYGTGPDYLWPRQPCYAVLRHGHTQKWYGIIMDVAPRVLGLDSLTGQNERGEVDILNLKSAPVTVSALLEKPGFLPAYHMNKKHWVSILLDGSVPLKEIHTLLDQSYELTKNVPLRSSSSDRKKSRMDWDFKTSESSPPDTPEKPAIALKWRPAHRNDDKLTVCGSARPISALAACQKCTQLHAPKPYPAKI